MINVKTTQADHTDFVSIVPVELKGREFPWDKDEIAENLKDKELNAVKVMLNYKCQGWCLFSVVDGDIVIHRLTIKDETSIGKVLGSLFDTMTYTPKKQGCHVALDWPEYAVDHFLFKRLLVEGFATAGLIRDHYYAYGERWDGIKLEKQF